MDGESARGQVQSRRVDLDWIRIAAFALLIFYHIGMLFVSWDYHVKSSHIVRAVEPLMLALNPWRLALLFVVSGVATRFMLDTARLRELAARRSVRLLLPLAFGMLIVIPPQSYFEVVEKFGFAGSFGDFYWNYYLALRRIFCNESGATRSCLILPTWNHLWFVAYLWVYTLLLIALVGVAPKIVGLAEAKLSTFAVGATLLFPAAILCGARVFLFPIFRETHALTDDWYAHAVYFLVFAFGFFIARAETIWNAIERWRWAALILAVAAYSVVIITRFVLVDPSLLGPLTPVRQCAYGLQQWFAILAALGFGRRWLGFRDSPARRYFTDAIFPYYIVHQTIIVATAFALKPYGFSAASEAAIVITATVVGCAATYEVVRRVPPLRPLFGLKPPARPVFAIR